MLKFSIYCVFNLILKLVESLRRKGREGPVNILWNLLFFFILLLCFEVGTHHVALAVLKHKILLLLSLVCWD